MTGCTFSVDAGRSIAALPDDVGRWAVISTKPDEVWLDAHDDVT